MRRLYSIVATVLLALGLASTSLAAWRLGSFHSPCGDTASVQLPDGRTTRYRYGAHGEPQERINPDGSVVRYRHDEHHRLCAIEQPGGHTSQLSLDV
ncbi:RHS repeat protein, partial [Pseudomonas sp. ZM24]|uniref:RHS repeat domain-containing protein n=1 Tax=Pseudomonas triclosanedens TaxID=2961893 RepID=UPI0020C3D287